MRSFKNGGILAKNILDELERILGSDTFQARRSLGSFLQFVVEETLAGNADRIKAYTVAVRGLGRPPSFCPRSDPIVRVQAMRLRQTLTDYYQSEGATDPIRFDIPRGTYVPNFHLQETKIDTGGASSVSPPARPSGSPSLVILPFNTWQEDAEQLFLADGLGQAVAVALARYPELVVIGPLSRTRIDKQKNGLSGIARQYGSVFALDGHFRRTSNRFRLSVRLIDVASGSTFWAETYDNRERVSDPFIFEDAVSSQIATTLGDTHGIIRRALTREATEKQIDNMSVYDALVRYYHFLCMLSREARNSALAALERAVQMVPNNPLPLVYLAELYVFDYQMGWDDTRLSEAESLFGRAHAIDPDEQIVRFVAADLSFVKGERDPLIREIEQAIHLNPNRMDVVCYGGLYLALIGEWDRGIAMMERALRLEPSLPSWYRLGPVLNFYRQGMYREALAEAQLIKLRDCMWNPLLNAATLGQLSREREARVALGQLVRLFPDFATRGQEILKRWLFHAENVEMVWAGLCKAGLLELSSDPG